MTYDMAVDMVRFLPQSVKTVRGALGMSLRDVAADTGISFNTLSRMERGMPISGTHVVTMLEWLSKRQPEAIAALWDARPRHEGWADVNQGDLS